MSILDLMNGSLKKAGSSVKPCHYCPRQMMEMCNEAFELSGTEISTNPDPHKVFDRTEAKLSNGYIKTIRSAIQRYINDRYLELPEEDRPPYNIKLCIIWEHSISGKYHNHGIFSGMPNDMVDYVNRALSRRYGRTEIKMIRNQPKYIEYMFKSYIPELARQHGIETLEEFNDFDQNTIGLKI